MILLSMSTFRFCIYNQHTVSLVSRDGRETPPFTTSHFFIHMPRAARLRCDVCLEKTAGKISQHHCDKDLLHCRMVPNHQWCYNPWNAVLFLLILGYLDMFGDINRHQNLEKRSHGQAPAGHFAAARASSFLPDHFPMTTCWFWATAMAEVWSVSHG